MDLCRLDGRLRSLSAGSSGRRPHGQVHRVMGHLPAGHRRRLPEKGKPTHQTSPPLMTDLMCGPNMPLARAFLFCGWRYLPVDWVFDPTQELAHSQFQAVLHEQLQEVVFIAAALDCSTRSEPGRYPEPMPKTSSQRSTSRRPPEPPNEGPGACLPKQPGI